MRLLGSRREGESLKIFAAPCTWSSEPLGIQEAAAVAQSFLHLIGNEMRSTQATAATAIVEHQYKTMGIERRHYQGILSR